MAQRFEIVGVFIPTGDGKIAGAQDVGKAMDHPTLIVRFSNANGGPIRDPQASLGVRKQQYATMRCQATTIERGGGFPAANGLNAKTNPISSAMAVVELSVWSRGIA